MILLAPGPVYTPMRIRKAQTKEMISHRSRAFTELYTDIIERFKKYVNASDGHILTGSGTLGLETLMINLTEKKDKVLVLTNGVFGDKLGKIASIHANATIHSLEPGKGWDLEKAKGIIDEENADVIAMVYNETGYGVRNKALEIVGYAKKKGMRTILDVVSGWPGLELDVKRHKIDGFGTASQKGSSVPPGLAMIGLSDEAVEYIEGRESIPSFYCNLKEYRKRYKKVGQTPFTPAISIMWALQESFNIIDSIGGIEEMIRLTDRKARMVRERVKRMGFKMIPEEGFESPTVSAFKSENAKEIINKMRERGYFVVGCKGVFAENGIRIAHMGFIEEGILKEALNVLEDVHGKTF